jgi:predicted protein tyrosine phosphatase
MFQGWRGKWEARSAGIMPSPGGNPLSQELIDWADVIIVMEPIHSQHIRAHFQGAVGKIYVLNIADRYFRDDPKLKQELYKKVPCVLDGA